MRSGALPVPEPPGRSLALFSVVETLSCSERGFRVCQVLVDKQSWADLRWAEHFGRRVRDRLQRRPVTVDAIVMPRFGQGAFLVLVSDAYWQTFPMTSERILPIFEAAYIWPYAAEGPHAFVTYKKLWLRAAPTLLLGW